MGLCKCPKRKITNQFCYEHRVNVCEYCIVTNHSKCIVLSYLKWLQDGDYNPVCQLCDGKLNEQDCIRLVCYHVFHWQCLDQFARQLPSTTAPAGYKCPTCNSPLFPPSNLVSPVADVLREKLHKVNWARVGLGLPIIVEEYVAKENKTSLLANSTDYHDETKIKQNDTIVHIEEFNDAQYDTADIFEDKFPNNIPRRLTHTHETRKSELLSFDHDDNKYERKSIAEKLNRWHLCAKNSRYFHFYFKNKYRRYTIIGTFLFVGFFLLMLTVEKLSGNRNLYDNDSVFNPMLNSYVRVNDGDS